MLKNLKCQTGVCLCVRVQDSFHRQRSPSLEREAQIPPLRMDQMRNIPIFSGHFTVFLHPPKAEQISLPLEATSAKPNVVGTHEVVEGVCVMVSFYLNVAVTQSPSVIFDASSLSEGALYFCKITN